MSTFTVPTERTRALRNHLESIQHRIDRSAGALRAARDLSIGDGSIPRSPHLQFLRMDDFVHLTDLIIDQLELAATELDSTYQEVQS